MLSTVKPVNAADVYIKVVQTGKKMPLGLAAPADEFSSKINDIVRLDLLFSRYFEIRTPDYKPADEKTDLKFWKNQGVEAVVFCNVIRSRRGFIIEGKVFDASTLENILQKNFKGAEENYAKPAHEFADEIVRRLTGQRGVSRTKIAFVNDSTGHKEIYAVGYDGANARRLTTDGSIAVTPKWSPDGSKIAFTSWRLGNPDLFVMNGDGAGKKQVSSRQGLNASPSWSSNGEKIALTLSMGKSPNVYLINPAGEILKQVTRGNDINTSPALSRNGTQMVFISDRAGYPQMYLTDTEGTNVRRIYTDGYTDAPCWSPRGDAIVFAMKTSAGFFDIYLYDILNAKQFQLTSNSGSNESPSFSPDGRFIVFSSTRNGRKELFTMFADGSGQMRLLDIKGNSEMPDWSP